MPQSSNIASNGMYLEKLGHFFPNLSQSNSSLGPGYAAEVKAKTGAIGKIYRWPGERERVADPSQAFPLPRLWLGLLRLPLFFLRMPIFFSFFPQCVAWFRLVKLRGVKLHVPCCFVKPVISHEETYTSNLLMVCQGTNCSEYK